MVTGSAGIVAGPWCCLRNPYHVTRAGYCRRVLNGRLSREVRSFAAFARIPVGVQLPALVGMLGRREEFLDAGQPLVQVGHRHLGRGRLVLRQAFGLAGPLGDEA